jgi:DNA repair photolyase
MIIPYFGEFLVNPAPLHLSGNWCSHDCAYCFANLNKPDRQLDLKATIRFLKNFHKQKNLAARLLQEKYPIIVSNHVDPFSLSNYRQLVPLMRMLTHLEIPIAIQTKGGKEDAIAETLKFLPPSVWYISISHSSEETRKQIEFAAPDLDSRYRLIERVTKLKHQVIVGFNPCVPEWSKDPYKLLNCCVKAGAYGVWIETLHLNYKQRDALKSREKDALGSDIIKRAMKKHTASDDSEHFLKCRAIASELGLEIYSSGQATRSDIFQPFKQLYPKTFPITQDWVNYCHDNAVEVFSFRDWYDFFAPKLPNFSHNKMKDYIYQGIQKWQLEFKLPNEFDYGQLLAFALSDKRIRCAANPIQLHPCSYLALEDEDEKIHAINSEGFPCFVFCPDGIDYEYGILESVPLEFVENRELKAIVL